MQAAGWLAGWWLLWSLPPPAGSRPPAGPTSTSAAAGGPGGRPRLQPGVAAGVSAIIPARNEASALPRLLRSLAAQNAALLEVLVVDDHSTDATAAVAAAAGATVVPSAPLPAGWTGKTWACHQGAARAHGTLLWFLDADVTVAPGALGALLAEHAARGGLVSVQPFHTTERPYEALSAVCNVVTLMGTGAFSGPPRRPAAMAFGPCLLIGRDDYQRCGGHAHPTVRPLIAEDIGLARRCRSEGLPVSVFAGRDLVAFRMYPGGIRQLAEGWAKMLAYGARSSPPTLAAAVGVWVSAALLGAAGLAGRRHPAAVAAGCYAAWAAQLHWMLRRVGRFGWLAAAGWPVPMVAFVVLFGRSAAFRAAGRAARWRGRLAPVA